MYMCVYMQCTVSVVPLFSSSWPLPPPRSLWLQLKAYVIFGLITLSTEISSQATSWGVGTQTAGQLLTLLLSLINVQHQSSIVHTIHQWCTHICVVLDCMTKKQCFLYWSWEDVWVNNYKIVIHVHSAAHMWMYTYTCMYLSADGTLTVLVSFPGHLTQ